MILIIILRCMESIIFFLTGFMLLNQKTKLTRFKTIKALIIFNHIAYVVNIISIVLTILNLWLIQLGNADYFGLETSLSKVLLYCFVSIIIYIALWVVFKKFINKLESLMNNMSKQTVIYCSNCGIAINSMMTFCTNCGYEISGDENKNT